MSQWLDISEAPKGPISEEKIGMMGEPHGPQIIGENGVMMGEAYWVGESEEKGDWVWANNDSCNCCWGDKIEPPLTRFVPFPER